MIDYRWPCPTCHALVYGLGQHMTSHGRICKTSGPIPGGGVLSSDGAPLGERGSLGDPPSPLGEPHASVVVDDACGSVPPRKDADK